MTRYQHLATLLAERIEQGLYRHGEKLPSVRSLSQEHGVSISTVQQAYQLLEQQQMIVPQPRSGYFVAPRKAQPPVPPMSRPVQRPVEITQWDQVLTMLDARYDKSIIPFGGGSPDVTQPSLKPIWRELSRAIQHNLTEVLNYDELAGRRELREQIARLMLDGGSVVTADDLVLTSGCHSALSLALLSVCQPGDIIAVESPCYYGTMQMLRGLGLKTIEIPTDPETGISIEALELALDQWPIKGVILVPNCNNPLGFIMPDARKRAVLNLAQRYDIVIFEDDIYGELATEYPRPRTIKSFDEDGRVLLCSSFSKTLAPGLRIGWVAPGRYLERVLHMKYISTGSTATQPQIAIAEFLKGGHFEPHLRRMRTQYQRNRDAMIDWVTRYFPAGTRASRPQGSFMLWVELPEGFDTLKLNRALHDQGVQIAVGSIFSASGKYRNCLRMNYAAKPTAQIEDAVRKVGAAAIQLLAETSELND